MDLEESHSVAEPKTDSVADPSSAINSNRIAEMPDVAADLLLAELARKEGDLDTAIRLANQVLDGAATYPDAIHRAAAVLIRAKRVEDGILALEQLRKDNQTDSTTALMLISAHRLRARKADDSEDQVDSMRRAGDIVRDMIRTKTLQPLGEKGLKLFERVSMEEAAVCAARGQQTEAIAALRSLLGAGYYEVAALAELKAWDPIRENAAFLQLIEDSKNRIRTRLQVSVREMMAQQSAYPFEFRLQRPDGHTVSSTQFEDKILVVDFWGSWCGPCRMLSPHLKRLQNEYGDQLQVVGIAYEKAARYRWADIVQRYMDEHDVPYPCVLGDDETKYRASIAAFPTLLFIDRTGQVRLTLRGLHDYQRIEAISRLLIDETD